MEEAFDEAIWQDLLAGNTCRFGLIWDRHKDRVFQHFRKTGGLNEDAEDMTATVFLELWRRRRAVRFVDGSLLPWLIVTAQNVARNSNRARIRYQTFLAKLPPPVSMADPVDTITERFDETILAIRRVMSASSSIDRKLLALTALEGFTVREAASTLNISESAAKMRLSRLRMRLQSTVTPIATER